MAMLVAGVLFLFCCSAYGNPFKDIGYGPLGDPELEWQALSRAIAKERAPVLSPRASLISSLPLPGFLRIAASADNKALLSPEMVARPLQDAVKKILLATPLGLPAVTTSAVRPLVEALCHLDRIYVRVRRELFNTKTAYKYLKLGSCVVNRANTEFYYFLYLRKNPCGFTRQDFPDFTAINIELHFQPIGPVLWEVPFDVHVQCNYHKIHHVYSAGIQPKLMGGTVFRKLGSKAYAVIIPKDAAGNELTAHKTYTIGQQMFFEAKLVDTQSADQRLYVKKCYMTASQDSNSSPKYTVIDNQGCMVAAIITNQAKFLTQASKSSLAFSLSALVFREMLATPGTPKKIYMHCEISAGPLTATASMKSCNFETSTKRWRELYDNDAVCSCCDTSCLPQARASNTMYTSSALVVDGLDLESNFKSGTTDNNAEIIRYLEDDDYWKTD